MYSILLLYYRLNFASFFLLLIRVLFFKYFLSNFSQAHNTGGVARALTTRRCAKRLCRLVPSSQRGTSSVRSRRRPPKTTTRRRRTTTTTRARRCCCPEDANATRRRFDALEEEEENDVHRPPGLSHAAVREDGDGDSGDDFSGDDDDDDDDDENLDDSSLASTNSSLEKFWNTVLE